MTRTTSMRPSTGTSAHRSSRDVDYGSSRHMHSASRDVDYRSHHYDYDRHDERPPRHHRDESRLSPREDPELRRQATAGFSARGQRFYGGRPPEDSRTAREDRDARLRQRTHENKMMAATGEMPRTQAYALNTMAYGAHAAKQVMDGRYSDAGRGALYASKEAGKTVISTLLNEDAHPLTRDFAHETVAHARDSIGALVDGDFEGGAKSALKSLVNAGKTVATTVLTREPYRPRGVT